MAFLSRILGLFLLLIGSTSAHNGPPFIPRPYILAVATPPSPTTFESALLLTSASTGDYKQIGSAPYKPIGQSSAVSYCQDLMFIVGWNQTQRTTALLGFNTTTGDVIHEIKLPFYQPSNNNYPAPAGVGRSGSNYFVFGMENEKGPLVGGFVNFKAHALEKKVVITHETNSLSFKKSNDSVTIFFGGPAGFIVGVQEHHRQRFFSVNMESSSVKEFGTGDFTNIVDLKIYAERGVMLGIGILPTEDHSRNISVVKLSRSLEFEAKYSIELYNGSGDIGPLGIAHDSATMYWMQHGFLAQADMHLEQNQKMAYFPRSPAKISNLEFFSKYKPWCP